MTIRNSIVFFLIVIISLITLITLITFVFKDILSPSKNIFSREDTLKIEKAFIEYTSERWFREFSKQINKHRAIVCGGSILSALNGEKINDFDTYINLHNLLPFIKDLKKLGMRPIWDMTFTTGNTPEDQYSNFRRYNILLRIPLTDDKVIVDIVVIHNGTSLKDIISTSDFTFCQNWWDGNNFYSNYPDHIKNRRGYMKPSDMFINSKKFIRRIYKYSSRGFEVTIKPMSKNDTEIKKVGKEEEMVRLFLHHSYNMVMKDKPLPETILKYAFIVNTTPSNYTVTELSRIFPDPLLKIMVHKISEQLSYEQRKLFLTVFEQFNPINEYEYNIENILHILQSMGDIYIDKCEI